MSIRLMATISAMTVAAALTVTAQTPNPQTPQTQPTDRQRPTTDTQGRANASDQAVTVTGCLQAEKDVPGRSASTTERAGMGEDYVLTNVKMSQGAATSGLGLATMYQIKGGSLGESELKKHLGHQVEITGRLENNNSAMRSMPGTGTGATGATGATSATGRTGAAGTTGTTGAAGTTGRMGAAGTTGDRMSGNANANNNSNLQNLEATSLKMVSASCPAAK